MKTLPLFFLLIPIVAVSQSHPFVPLNYEYPKAILSTPSTYVYKTLSTSEINYKDISRRDEPGKVIITWKDYGGNITDSCVEVNDKAVDHYLIVGEKYFKGASTEDSTYKDGTRLGEKRQSECFTINAATQMCEEIKSRFLKDTVMTWNNRRVETIVVESEGKIILQNPNDTTQKQETPMAALFYFGKDVGMLRYVTTSAGKTEVVELQEIKPQSNQSAKN